MNTLGIPDTWQDAPLLHAWPYRSRDCRTILGVVARYESTARRKSVVPFFKRDEAGGWAKGGPTEPYPLFGLETLDREGDVFIVEGERCAAALHGLGLAALTSQGGSSAASKSDWGPLSGVARVYLLPDNDEPGEKYTFDVASALAALPRPPQVLRVALPGLPEKCDVVDWLQARVPEWDGFAPLPADKVPLNAFTEAVRTHAQKFTLSA